MYFKTGIINLLVNQKKKYNVVEYRKFIYL